MLPLHEHLTSSHSKSLLVTAREGLLGQIAKAVQSYSKMCNDYVGVNLTKERLLNCQVPTLIFLANSFPSAYVDITFRQVSLFENFSENTLKRGYQLSLQLMWADNETSSYEVM